MADFDGDGDVDLADFGTFAGCFNGPNRTPACAADPIPASMVLIPAGEFAMGDTFNDGDPDERPVHAVQTDAFVIDQYEVTNQQYADGLNWARAQGNLISVSSGKVYKFNTGVIYPYCDTTTSSS
ncbi:MAG: SUMF1/EgtB/PvdO family nonheme iron enzyme, partial [Phycisphaerae bacterium]|nr:SUMF1/EgtB/PvdO family nonheme iron enzyme [Phycisphaerae bacterium]